MCFFLYTSDQSNSFAINGCCHPYFCLNTKVYYEQNSTQLFSEP